MIGKKIIYEIDGLKIPCTVTDTKHVYGRVVYKIEPINGEGYKWTNKVQEEEDNVV